MRIECLREKLEKAVSLADRATNKNPTLPILSAVLLEFSPGEITVKSTNLEIGIEVSFPAKSEKTGRVAIKGATLAGFLSNATADKQVVMDVTDGNIKVKSGGSEAVIKGVSPDDFPQIPRVSGGTSVTLPAGHFADGVRSVSFAASPSHVKPELASVVVFSDRKNLVFVSTDSFRLAEKKVLIDSDKEIGQTIIPVKNAVELARILEEASGNKVKFVFGKNQMSAEADGLYFVSRVVDGSFPDYKQIIPKDCKTEAVALKEELSRALKTSVVFSDSFNQTVFSVSPAKRKIELKSKNADIGEGSTSIQAAISGEETTASFNHRYVSDCLQVIRSDSVSLSFSEGNKPAVLRGVSDTTFTYIVMPMNR